MHAGMRSCDPSCGSGTQKDADVLGTSEKADLLLASTEEQVDNAHQPPEDKTGAQQKSVSISEEHVDTTGAAISHLDSCAVDEMGQSDEQLPAASNKPVEANGGPAHAGADVCILTDTNKNTRMTRSRAARDGLDVSEEDGTSELQENQVPEQTYSDNEGKILLADSFFQPNHAAIKHGQEGKSVKRRRRATQQSVRRTHEEVSQSVSPRRTRSRASSVTSELEENVPVVGGQAQRNLRSRRGNTSGGAAEASVGATPNANPVARRRTRATSASVAGSTSADTEGSTDDENQGKHVATSQLKEPNYKLLETILSPIPEDVAVQPKRGVKSSMLYFTQLAGRLVYDTFFLAGKQRSKRRRPMKMEDVSEQASQRATRRVTRSQDTS